jgi:hypothetical protein
MVSNMKELCAYVEAKRRKRAHEHYEMAKVYGPCTGMGNKKYKLQQKSSFPKQYKAAYNKIWR